MKIITHQSLVELIEKAEEERTSSDFVVVSEEMKRSSHVHYGEEYIDHERFDEDLRAANMSDRMYPDYPRIDDYKVRPTTDTTETTTYKHYTLSLADLLKSEGFEAIIVPGTFSRYNIQSGEHETFSVDASGCENLLDVPVLDDETKHQLKLDLKPMCASDIFHIEINTFRSLFTHLSFTEAELHKIYKPGGYLDKQERLDCFRNLFPDIHLKSREPEIRERYAQLTADKQRFFTDNPRKRKAPKQGDIWNKVKAARLVHYGREIAQLESMGGPKQ